MAFIGLGLKISALKVQAIKNKWRKPLHELTHAVTYEVMLIAKHSTELANKILNKEQLEGIKEMQAIFYKLKKQEKSFSGKWHGMSNELEFAAELSQPAFREELKKFNIFEKVLRAIGKITGVSSISRRYFA